LTIHTCVIEGDKHTFPKINCASILDLEQWQFVRWQKCNVHFMENLKYHIFWVVTCTCIKTVF